MKKIFALILLLYVSMLGYAQRDNQVRVSNKKLKNDTIIWRPDSSLIKEDFHAKKAPGAAAGLSSVGIFIFPQESGGTIVFNVESIFVKSRSFLVDNSPYILKHEQLHFDICELYARKLRKMIKDKDFRKVHDIQGEIQRMYTKASEEMFREQEKYDNDTEHGLNPAKQKVWDETIPAQLKELEDYSTISINIER